MVERRALVELWKRGEAVALVTLVHAEGSSYRRPGARMLIAAGGEFAGTISGGCLEAEVLRKAAWMIRDGAVVERYSTLFDDTAEIPYGLGCGGTIDLLIEPAGTAEFTALMRALEQSLDGVAAVVTTLLPGAGAPLRRFIHEASGAAAERVDSPERGVSRFEEELRPPQRLVCVGAGEDAKPLVRLAGLLGWSVTVVDRRAHWARAERFPEAACVLVSESIGPVGVRPDDAVVLMTHSYEQDRDFLAELLPLAPRYLGLLGARHRSALLVGDVAARLGWSVERVCEGLFAPVGLDLGGDGPEAIALAVIAEVQASLQGKLGQSRRLTAAMVETLARTAPPIALQATCAL